MQEFLSSFSLLFALLNPFLMSIYLLDLIRDLDFRGFRRVVSRGCIISFVVFVVFAWGGDAIFTKYLNVHFASFQIFGGIVFALIGIRFVFEGAKTLESMRGEAEYLAGSVAMPFMIGPGTLSASVLIGGRLSPMLSCLTIAATMLTVLVAVSLFKWVHDYVRASHERLIERYVDIVGRASGLLIGTIAAEMIFWGLSQWIATMEVQGANVHP